MRSWMAVYSAMVTKPKYRRLSAMGRGALLHVFLLACYQDPEAWWADAEDLRDALRLEGFPGGLYDELVAYGWLESNGAGVAIHDWDQHQWAADAEARKRWEAAWKREWRKKRKGDAPSPAPPTPEKRTTTTTTTEVLDMSGQVLDMPRTNGVVGGDVAFGEGFEDFEGEYRKLYRKTPSEKAMAWGLSLQDKYGATRVCAALRGEHRRDPNIRTILGRIDRGLRAGDLKALADSLAPPGVTA